MTAQVLHHFCRVPRCIHSNTWAAQPAALCAEPAENIPPGLCRLHKVRSSPKEPLGVPAGAIQSHQLLQRLNLGSTSSRLVVLGGDEVLSLCSLPGELLSLLRAPWGHGVAGTCPDWVRVPLQEHFSAGIASHRPGWMKWTLQSEIP